MQRGLGELKRRLNNIEERNFPKSVIEDMLFTEICIYGEQAIYDEIERFGEADVVARLESYLVVEVAERALEKETFETIENYLKNRRK